jgi:small redox-active disulfide protein 2
MIVKILGPGCRNCHALEERTREALTQLGLHAEIEAVTDYAEIARYGVMKTPGLVVDEEVLVAGKVPSAKELARILAAR